MIKQHRDYVLALRAAMLNIDRVLSRTGQFEKINTRVV